MPRVIALAHHIAVIPKSRCRSSIVLRQSIKFALRFFLYGLRQKGESGRAIQWVYKMNA